MATITNKSGTSAADKITVTASDLTVNAGLGDDEITLTGGSRNVIHGDDGADTIVAESGAGNDTLYGDNGGDVLYGDSGNNIFYDDSGTDVFYCYGSSDTIKDYQSGEVIYSLEPFTLAKTTVTSDGVVLTFGKNHNVSELIQTIKIQGQTSLDGIHLYSGENPSDYLT